MTIEEARFSKLQKWSFGLGSFTQWFVMGAFNTWVFSFYFSAVKLPVNYIMTAFIIWTIWNAVNDPIIGYLSDKTQTKWGRRKPFIVIGSIPIIIIEIIIWLPRQGNDTLPILYIPHAGHGLHLENPRDFWQLTLDILEYEMG